MCQGRTEASPESAGNSWHGACQRWVNFVCNPIVHADHFLDRGWALWSSVLEFHRFKGRSRHTGDNLAADLRGAVKRFEPSTGPREEFPKVTTVTRYEAANKVASGKLRDEADGWERQPALDHYTGCRDV